MRYALQYNIYHFKQIQAIYANSCVMNKLCHGLLFGIVAFNSVINIRVHGSMAV